MYVCGIIIHQTHVPFTSMNCDGLERIYCECCLFNIYVGVHSTVCTDLQICTIYRKSGNIGSDLNLAIWRSQTKPPY